MASVTLTFADPINVSLQYGDGVYYATTSSVGGINTVTSIDNIVYMGTVDSFTDTTIVVDWTANAEMPLQNYFIFFSKNAIANTASLVGYYMEVKMRNNSTDQAELFAVSTELAKSSK